MKQKKNRVHRKRKKSKEKTPGVEEGHIERHCDSDAIQAARVRIFLPRDGRERESRHCNARVKGKGRNAAPRQLGEGGGDKFRFLIQHVEGKSISFPGVQITAEGDDECAVREAPGAVSLEPRGAGKSKRIIGLGACACEPAECELRAAACVNPE